MRQRRGKTEDRQRRGETEDRQRRGETEDRQRRGETEDRQRRGEAAEAEDRLSGAGGDFLGQGLLVCVAVASLGLFLSALISHQIIESPPNRGKVEKAYVDQKCDQLASETWPAAKGFTLSTKSPYQFAEPVFNQEQVEGCSAVQVRRTLMSSHNSSPPLLSPSLTHTHTAARGAEAWYQVS